MAVVMATAAATLLAGCGGDDGGSTGTAAQGYDLVSEDALTTCTHLPYPPFQFDRDGKTVGFDVDLVDLIAEEVGVKQKIVDTPFEGIKSGTDLETGKCDIAAAGMSITPERQKVIDFSKPYFDATQSLLTKKGAGYDSFDALKGKKLGVQSGTTGLDYATENAKPAGVTLVAFEDLGTEIAALKSGQVDAVINDFPVLSAYAKDNPGYRVATQFDTGEQYGFGMSKDRDDNLSATADKVLTRAKKDGTYDRLYEKWFGQPPK